MNFVFFVFLFRTARFVILFRSHAVVFRSGGFGAAEEEGAVTEEVEKE